MQESAPAPAPRTRVLGLVVLVAGMGVGACMGLGHRPAPTAVPHPSRPSAPPPSPPPVPDPWSSTGRVPLRLAAADGALSLGIDLGSGAETAVRRVGDDVVDGGDRRASFLLFEPALPGGTVRFDGRLYAGTIVVEARAGGGLRAHAWLDLEDYVSGVVAAELALWNAPPALLEAQAVAARSYAVAQLEARAAQGPRPVLHDSVLDQAFRGRFEPDAAGKSRGLDTRLAAAVAATRGRVLELGGRVLDARFHAACGGHTADFSDVFREPDPGGMRSVPCAGCSADPKAWNHTFAPSDLFDVARRFELGDRLVAIHPARSDARGRWLDTRLVGDRGERVLPVQELRRELGWQRWRSAAVVRTWPRDGMLASGGLFVEGVGHGHGVGLCQNGARALADAGRDFRAILGHYYPGARLATFTAR